jgi:hypothetical protein
MLIDHLERHSDPVETVDFAATFETYRALADQLRQHDSWWGPIANIWNDLAARTDHSPAGAQHIHDVLIDAIERLSGARS